MVLYLIADSLDGAGAYVEIRDRLRETALLRASIYGYNAILESLLQQYMNNNHPVQCYNDVEISPFA